MGGGGGAKNVSGSWLSLFQGVGKLTITFTGKFVFYRFFEVTTQSWPEWDLNLQPLNSVQML